MTPVLLLLVAAAAVDARTPYVYNATCRHVDWTTNRLPHLEVLCNHFCFGDIASESARYCYGRTCSEYSKTCSTPNAPNPQPCFLDHLPPDRSCPWLCRNKLTGAVVNCDGTSLGEGSGPPTLSSPGSAQTREQPESSRSWSNKYPIEIVTGRRPHPVDRLVSADSRSPGTTAPSPHAAEDFSTGGDHKGNQETTALESPSGSMSILTEPSSSPTAHETAGSTLPAGKVCRPVDRNTPADWTLDVICNEPVCADAMNQAYETYCFGAACQHLRTKCHGVSTQACMISWLPSGIGCPWMCRNQLTGQYTSCDGTPLEEDDTTADATGTADGEYHDKPADPRVLSVIGSSVGLLGAGAGIAMYWLQGATPDTVALHDAPADVIEMQPRAGGGGGGGGGGGAAGGNVGNITRTAPAVDGGACQNQLESLFETVEEAISSDEEVDLESSIRESVGYPSSTASDYRSVGQNVASKFFEDMMGPFYR